MTASLLKCPRIFPVFWPFSTMIYFEWFLLVLQLPSPLNYPFVTVTNPPVTLMFHSFFNSRARSRYLSFFSHTFIFILWSAGTPKSTILQVPFFFFVDYYEVWSSNRDLVIRFIILYFIISYYFISFIIYFILSYIIFSLFHINKFILFYFFYYLFYIIIYYLFIISY